MNREEAIKVLNSRPYVGEVREALETLIPELRESKDERIRKRLIEALKASKTVGELKFVLPEPTKEECIAYLENLKDASKAIEVVDRIDKYIDEHLANAHDMKDSDPDKKYYLGWDAALGNMSGILQDVYSGEKQKEHQNNSDAHNESSWAGMISSSDKDKNLDEIAQDYIDGVKEYNPEPTWDLMQTAVCYGYHLAEKKPVLFIPKFRVGDMLISTKNSKLTYKILEVGHINELGNPEYKVEIFENGKPGIMNKPHNIHYMECHKVDEWGELIEQKPKLYWHKIKAYEQLPCKAYIYKFAYEQENNFHGKATIHGCLIPNEPVTIGCDTWYLPVEDIKNLPKEDELDTMSSTKTDEQKLTWSEEEMKLLDLIIKDYEKASKSFCGYDGKIGLLKAIRNGEYNLSKPAEWSDTNELVFKDICKHLKEEGYNGWVVLLNALRNGEFQPKQEWSEEDEERIQSILFSVGYCKEEYPNKKDYSKDINWLKSLHPQQKVEWSEKDEKQIRQIERIVKNAGCSVQLQERIHNWFKSFSPQSKIHYWTEEEIESIISDYLTGREHYGGMMSRLKCLKPKSHWKPSVEQMNTLLSVEGILRSLQYDDKAKILASIYEQLKKLM